MRNVRALLFVTALVSLAALLSGCGPGLLALAGGTGGGILGFGGKKDKGGKGGGGSTNTPPVVVINSLTREDAPATITYTLIDNESNLCSVNVTYSLDGSNYFGCTQGVGGDPTTFLNSGSGATHTFEWDYELDLLTQGLVKNIWIAITANDGIVDGPVASLSGLSVGNDAPVCLTSVSPVSPSVLVNGNLVLVNFVLTDTSADIAGMVVLFTLDQGQTFTELTAPDYVGTPPFALLTTTTGASGQFIWDSSVALPGFVGNNVLLLLVPVDKPTGWTTYTTGDPVPVGPFSLNNVNNGPPEITLISDVNGTSQVGTVNLQFTLTDTGSDSAVVALEYSDNGAPFVPARLVGQATPQDAGPFVCSGSPRLYSLTWDALADLGPAGTKSVELRLTPAEFGAPSVIGAPVLTGAFDITPNEAPEVTDFQVFQSAGNITVRLRLSDSSAENVSLAITARWNGGANSYVLGASDFVSGDISDCVSSVVGEDNLLIWNTTASANPLANANAPDVFWEISPTDKPVSSPGAALTGALYVSATFPVINDLSGTVPVGINLSENSGAVTVALGQQRNFTALIQPSSALDHTVTWDVVEGATYGAMTPVSSPTQGPQTATYDPPAVLPTPNQGYATVRCTSNAAPAVLATYRLYFGSAPTSVSVTPPAPDVVLGASQQFSASVLPGSAPQNVTWQVIGGASGGSIDSSGRYTAPNVMPGGGRTVTIRATSVVSSIYGEAFINLQPLPSSCLVTAATGGSTGPSQVTLGNSLQLVATITPPDAPQAVFWTIDWNGVGQGTGNPTVGTVNASGLYLAPNTLPTPSQVFVRARSQVASSVTDDYQIDLIAPPPTSFAVTPASVVLTAGGAGVDFDVINFVPSNANRSVTWTQNPVFGTLDAQTGVYTPPPNSSTTTQVTIRATSNVAPLVFSEAVVTVQPNAQVAPQSLVIVPNNGRTFVVGRALQYSANVLPSGAPQSVTWSVVSGPGSINSSGVYSPPVTLTALDGTCVIRCTSTVDSAVWAEVTIDLDGAGDTSSLSNSSTAMGRSEPVAFYDSAFDRILYCGGYSEADGNKHDDMVFAHNLTTNTWRYLSRMNPTQTANTIAWAHDTQNKFLYALVGNGGSSVGIYRMNLGLATPTWAQVTASGSGGDIASLPGTFRYMCMFDEPSKEIYICVSSANSVYRLDVGNPGSLSWRTKKTAVVGTPTTPQTEKCAYIYDTTRQRHTLIGTGTLTGSSTKVWYLVNGGGLWSWTEESISGSVPSGGLDDASAAYLNDEAWVFGGRPGLGTYSNSLIHLDMSAIPFVWSPISVAIGSRTPQNRGRAALIAFSSHLCMFGGKNLTGIFGDTWQYDFSTGWLQPAPDDMLPQGRKNAASTWVDTWGAGWVYGGICDYGVSDEMWRLEYNTGKNAWEWFLEEPSNLSTAQAGQLQGASLNFDATNDRLLLFAGSRTAGGTAVLSNNLYAYDPSSRVWSSPAASGGPPPVRFGHSSCYDSNNKRMIYFGGQDTGTPPFRSDVWMFNVQTSAWSQPTISGGIDGRVGAFAGWSPGNTRMYVLGGYTQASGATLQLYELVFTSPTAATWNSIATHQFGTPKSIVSGAAAFDLVGERFLTAPPSQYDNQALVFCHPVQGANPPPTWQTMNLSGLTHGIGATGMYDSVNGRFICFGGETDLGGGKFRKLNQLRVVRLK